MGFSRQSMKLRLHFHMGYACSSVWLVELLSNAQHEIIAREQWGVGVDVSLPDCEIFRPFRLLFLSEMESAGPTHLQLSLRSQDPMPIWQRHGPREKHASLLKSQGKWVYRKASGSAVCKESSI